MGAPQSQVPSGALSALLLKDAGNSSWSFNNNFASRRRECEVFRTTMGPVRNTSPRPCRTAQVVQSQPRNIVATGEKFVIDGCISIVPLSSSPARYRGDPSSSNNTSVESVPPFVSTVYLRGSSGLIKKSACYVIIRKRMRDCWDGTAFRFGKGGAICANHSRDITCILHSWCLPVACRSWSRHWHGATACGLSTVRLISGFRQGVGQQCCFFLQSP